MFGLGSLDLYTQRRLKSLGAQRRKHIAVVSSVALMGLSSLCHGATSRPSLPMIESFCTSVLSISYPMSAIGPAPGCDTIPHFKARAKSPSRQLIKLRHGGGYFISTFVGKQGGEWSRNAGIAVLIYLGKRLGQGLDRLCFPVDEKHVLPVGIVLCADRLSVNEIWTWLV